MNTFHNNNLTIVPENKNELDEILFLTSYPPRECGIATYSQDLIKAIENKFNNSFSLKVCALESNGNTYHYPPEVKFTLKTSLATEYKYLSIIINNDDRIKIVLIQHEFGFYMKQEEAFLQFLYDLSKPVIIVFHTVLPNPDILMKFKTRNISTACESIIVMTKNSAKILAEDYGVLPQKISVIAHGTHLVLHLGKKLLKLKYGLENKKVLSTFGLLSSGKSIETTLDALPSIIKECPEVVFLIIGKTHPEVVKSEGEKYRKMLEAKVKTLEIEDNVLFINNYLALPELLEYLQLTDIYLFTTNDPNQAVSGTFAYAMSCGCPIISTPIPHAKEVLTKDTGIIFDFRNSKQLAESVISLLNNEPLRKKMSTNALQKIVATSWENSAVAHAQLFRNITNKKIKLQYKLPDLNLSHLKKMTTNIGMIQFSKINHPDITSGYTLDDNARALIVCCMNFKLNANEDDVYYINKYLSFIKHSQQKDGDFYNYIDANNKFTDQNKDVNLDDANGRAIWALGYLISLKGLIPQDIISEAKSIFKKALPHILQITSSRAMAFAVKGFYYYYLTIPDEEILSYIKTFANRLVQMYKHESVPEWEWFESYLTYANSILPEALLYTWIVTKEQEYKDIALSSFGFLLSKTFNKNGIEVISNKKWLQKGAKAEPFGEQPIDVAYTILTLSNFYDVFGDTDYRLKMFTAFNWFLGKNRLHQIVYNPCTGGCYDGLEEKNVNLNQGAESTVSYLMARLCIAQYHDMVKPKIELKTNNARTHIKLLKPAYSTNFNKNPFPHHQVLLPLYLD
ncbi:MAG: glycosyltransferase [Bacteroidetes bacterium]|nr:glycosyltransferase [Bacteroidota bacterium]